MPKPYEILAGFDGNLYVVFPNSYERKIYAGQNPLEFKCMKVVHYGQHENAYQLTFLPPRLVQQIQKWE